MSDLRNKYGSKNAKSESQQLNDKLTGVASSVAKKEGLLWAATKVTPKYAPGFTAMADGIAKTVTLAGLEAIGPKALSVGVTAFKIASSTPVIAVGTFIEPGQLSDDDLTSPHSEWVKQRALAELTEEQRQEINRINNMPAASFMPQLQMPQVDSSIEIAALRQLATTTSGELSNLQQQQMQNRIEEMQLEDDLHGMQRDKNECEQNVRTKEKETSQCDREIDCYEKRLQDLQHREQEITEKCRELNTKTDAENEKLESLHREKQSCEDEIRNLESELQSKQAEFDKLKKQVPYYCENHTLEQMAAGQCGKLNDECAKCGPYKLKEVQSFLQGLMMLKRNIDSITSNLGGQKNKLHSIESSLKQTEMQLTDTQRDLEQQEYEKRTVKSDIREVEQDLKQEQQRKYSLEGEISEFKGRIQSFSAEEEIIQSKIQAIQSSSEQLTEQVSNKIIELQAANTALEEAMLKQLAQQELLEEARASVSSKFKY